MLFLWLMQSAQTDGSISSVDKFSNDFPATTTTTTNILAPENKMCPAFCGC